MTPDELISWRKQRNINQGQVADLIGVSRQTVINWERKHYAIPDDLEVRLSRAVPALNGQRARGEGRITPAAFPHLYQFERDIMRYRPTAKHPIQLARRGLFGWSGLSWLYANVSDCSKPRAELLETDDYMQAVEDLEAGRLHPGVEAVKAWFKTGVVAEGLEITRGTIEPWPTLRLNDAVQPWEGYNNPHAPPPLPEGAMPWAIVRPPLPAGYYWSPSNQMVFLEEVDVT